MATNLFLPPRIREIQDQNALTQRQRKIWKKLSDHTWKIMQNKLRRLSNHRKSRRRHNCRQWPHRRRQRKPAFHPPTSRKRVAHRRQEDQRRKLTQLLLRPPSTGDQNPPGAQYERHRKLQQSCNMTADTGRAPEANAQLGHPSQATDRHQEFRPAQTPRDARFRGPQATLRWSWHRPKPH